MNCFSVFGHVPAHARTCTCAVLLWPRRWTPAFPHRRVLWHLQRLRICPLLSTWQLRMPPLLLLNACALAARPLCCSRSSHPAPSKCLPPGPPPGRSLEFALAVSLCALRASPRHRLERLVSLKVHCSNSVTEMKQHDGFANLPPIRLLCLARVARSG